MSPAPRVTRACMPAWLRWILHAHHTTANQGMPLPSMHQSCTGGTSGIGRGRDANGHQPGKTRSIQAAPVTNLEQNGRLVNCEMNSSMVFSTSGVRHSSSGSTKSHEQQQLPIVPALHT